MKRLLPILLLAAFALAADVARGQITLSTANQTVTGTNVLPAKADPGSPATGELWLSTTDADTLKFRSGGVTHSLVTSATIAASYQPLDAVLTSLSNLKGPVTTTLTFGSSGDTAGVVYFLGTTYLTASFSNPNGVTVTVVRSSNETGTAANLTDRTTNTTWTNNAANSWAAIDLGSGRALTPTYYSLRATSSANGTFPRNWKLQGSNNVGSNDVSGINAATWADLDTRTNDTTINSDNAWGSFAVTGASTGYRWLRILQTGLTATGDNYLTIAEFEFYGSFAYTAGIPSGILTYDLSGDSVSTFSTSAGLRAQLSDETGTGAAVFATSPTLVTPVLGVASATSINKVAITAPATSATLTIADGKTLTASNTLTFTGTDGSTLNVGTGGTLGTAAYTATTAYQAADAELAALAGLTSAADKLPYFTGSGTAAVADFTAGGRALVNSAGTADTFPYFSASNTVTLASITTAGRNLLDDASASAQRTTLGVGTGDSPTFAAATLSGNLTFGTSASVLNGTTGSIGLTATGTNQSITLTPSGTGQTIVNRLALGNLSLATGIQNDAAPNLWSTNGGGVYPYNIVGNLIIQPRTSAARDIVLANGSTNPTNYAIFTSTGNLLVGGTTDITGSGGLKVFGTTASTSTTSGALQVAGGVGVAGAGWFGGDLAISRSAGTSGVVAFGMRNGSETGGDTIRLQVVARSGTNAFGEVGAGGSSDRTNILAFANGVSKIGVTDAFPLALYTNSTERARVTHVGEFVIGSSTALNASSGISPTLQVINPVSGLHIQQTANNASAPGIYSSKSRGGAGVFTTATQSGDLLAYYTAEGADGVSALKRAAAISMTADGLFSATSSPGKISFFTTPSASTTDTERMSIDNAGKVSVLVTTEATTAGAGSLTTAGGIYAAKKVVAMGGLVVDKTITAGGTTGAQTINKPAGTVNFAAAATSLVVTNSLVTTSSIIICTVGTNDATMHSVQAVAGSGSFTLYPNAAPTGETRVNFHIIN